MTRLRPRAEKAESLFVENLKRFSTASTQSVSLNVVLLALTSTKLEDQMEPELVHHSGAG